MSKRIDQLNSAASLDGANDVLPIWQPGQTTPKTRKVTAGAIAALNAAAIAQAQASAQAAEDLAIDAMAEALDASNDAAAAQATADAAIPLSQKGQPNGVATLDNSGKVPASQLTLVSTSFKGNWDATANSPTLTDGTGTGGDFYFIQNGTSRNLGSGAVNWTTGALVIHDGTKWVENEAVNNVISVNGQQGAVVLDTSDVAPTTDRNYVMDDWYNAMDSALTPPSNLNPFATIADLTGGGGGNTYNITISGGENLVTGYGDGTNQVGGTGTSRTLSSLGYTNGTAAAQWPLAAAAWGGITAASTEYDEVALQEALLTLAQTNYLRELKAGAGILNIRRGNIIWPSYKTGISDTNNSKLFVFDGQGCLFNCLAASAYVFTSSIASQTEAANSALDNVWQIKNFKIEGQGTGVGFRMGASRSFQLDNVHFKSFAKGFVGGLLLNAHYRNCTTNFCTQHGFFIDRGWWSGAAYSTAGNQPLFDNCRFRTNSNTQIGCAVTGADSVKFDRCTFEGSGGLYGAWIDNDPTTVAKNVEFDCCRWEIDDGNQFEGAMIYFRAANGYTIVINQPYNQTTVANTVLLEMENTQGTNIARIQNCIYSTASGSDRWQYKNVNTGGNGGWIFDNAFIQGNPTTPAEIVDTLNFPNVWAAGSDIPPSSRIRIPVTRIQ